MALVVMSVEGCLAAPSRDRLINRDSLPAGRALFKGLRDAHRVVLLADDPDRDSTRTWLAREHILRYADVHCYPKDSLLTAAEWRAEHVFDLLGIGHHVAMLIDADPWVVQNVTTRGVHGLLFVQASELPGVESPPYSSWYDLVGTIEAQSNRRAATLVEDEDGQV